MINSIEQKSPQSIASETSAFWPFTESIENINFLTHLVDEDENYAV